MATTQKLTELPVIQYTGMDYSTVISEIKKIIEDNPDWKSNWVGFYNSEAGTMLVQLMAWIADNLGIRQDMLYNESFLVTAQKQESQIKHLKQIGYYTKQVVAATVPVTISLGNSANKILLSGADSSLSVTPDSFLRIVGKDTNGQETNYELMKANADGIPDYLAQIYIDPSSNELSFDYDTNGNRLVALQGKTKMQEFTSDTRDGPYFDLDAENVAYNSIRIYDVDEGMLEHKQVSSFMNTETRAMVNITPSFIIERNDYNHIRIRYPSESIMTYDGNTLDDVNTTTGVKHRMFVAGHTIRVYYRVADGKTGNIPTGFINTTVNLKDSNGTKVTAEIYNEIAGYGGKNSEELDEAVINAPSTLKTVGRAVTADDYDNIISNSNLTLKSATYTPSNQPNNFSDYYGRKINPQEAFTFLIMNKNFNNLSGKDYNNFPWVDTNKVSMLNEKYVFGEAELNSVVNEISSTYASYLLLNDGSPNEWYRNGTIISTNVNISNALSNDEKKDAVKIKLHKNETDAIYITKVKEDLMASSIFDSDVSKETISLTYSNGKDVGENDFLTYEQPILINNNVHAICISAADTKLKENEPIDCRVFNEIHAIIDNEIDTTISLKLEAPATISENGYYLLIDNEHPVSASDSAFIDELDKASNKEKVLSKTRYGICQLINKQMLSLTSGNDLHYRLYDGNHAYQNLGLNVWSPEQGKQITEQGYYIIGINNNDTETYDRYAFYLGDATREALKNYYASINEAGSTQKYCYIKSLDKRAYIDTSSMYYKFDGTKYVNETVEVGDNVSAENGYFQRLNVSNYEEFNSENSLSFNDIVEQLRFMMYANVSGLANEITLDGETKPMVYKLNRINSIYDWEPYSGTELSDLSIEVTTRKRKNTESYQTDNSDNYYDIVIYKAGYLEDKIENDLIASVTDPKSQWSSLLDVLNASPEPIKQISYNNIASAGYVNGTYRLVISSPTTGPESSLMFCKSGTTDSTDFMNYLGVEYTNKKSEVVTGEKKLILYLKDCIQAYKDTTSSSDINGDEAEKPEFGDIIYQDNDINHTFRDIGLFISFKLSNANALALNKYENFYYSDDEVIDAKVKPSIISIEGANVYSVDTNNNSAKYYIDKNKSDFDVRLTIDTVDTNSIYSINKPEELKKLNIIENRRVIVETARIEADKVNLHINVPLVFSIDAPADAESYSDDSCFSINVGYIDEMSSDSLYNSVYSYLKTYARDSQLSKNRILPYNIHSLCYKSNENNKIIFSNLLKTDNAKVRFYYPSAEALKAAEIQDSIGINDQMYLYKKIFGTNITNPDFYALYPKDEMLKINEKYVVITKDNENKDSIDKTLRDGEYYYSPVANAQCLTFKYREFVDTDTVTKESKLVSKWGDYYIDVDDADGFEQGYNFHIVKTELSESFPDAPFYVHFINDRTYDPQRDYVENGILTDEDSLQNYMKNKKITSTEINFLKPYFRTFDIEASISYDGNYKLEVVKESVNQAIENAFGLRSDNIFIGNSISKSKLISIIMNVDGVKDVRITYFGYNYLDREKYPSQEEELTADFYEVLSLYSPDETNAHGKIFTYKKAGTSEYY